MDSNSVKNLMQKAIDHLVQEYSQLQIWRASTSLVDNINVYIPEWDMKQKLNQVGSTSLLDSQTIKIESWDKKNLACIEKAIYDNGNWLTPQHMGSYIMIKIPPLTKERRQDLTKVVSQQWEEIKVRIRWIRHDEMKILKTQLENKEISEDDKKRDESILDELTKDFTAKIDKLVKIKSEEIMSI